MCDDEIHQGRVATLSAPGPTGPGLVGPAVVERDVEVATPDGQADAALFHPEGDGPWPAVLLWPDALSLRPVFRDMGRRLAADGYVVLVPNLYYRVRPAPVLEDPFDFAVPADREKLMALMAGVTTEGTNRDAAAYVAFLDAQPQTDRGRPVGTQGYCMGGALAFRTAAAAPARVGAVASFHGGRLATDGPDSPHLLVPTTRAEYLVAVADNDDRADPAAKDTLAAALAAAQRPGKVEVYKGADHGWAVRGSQVYDETAAERAWNELLALYRRALA
ncbi:MAG: dienelactone hydrolase family protein [Acidobacteria bacterium]|nr:dienelactone hydrolase family protein [Acidobacteriota bacterium]